MSKFNEFCKRFIKHAESEQDYRQQIQDLTEERDVLRQAFRDAQKHRFLAEGKSGRDQTLLEWSVDGHAREAKKALNAEKKLDRVTVDAIKPPLSAWLGSPMTAGAAGGLAIGSGLGAWLAPKKHKGLAATVGGVTGGGLGILLGNMLNEHYRKGDYRYKNWEEWVSSQQKKASVPDYKEMYDDLHSRYIGEFKAMRDDVTELLGERNRYKADFDTTRRSLDDAKNAIDHVKIDANNPPLSVWLGSPMTAGAAGGLAIGSGLGAWLAPKKRKGLAATVGGVTGGGLGILLGKLMSDSQRGKDHYNLGDS